MGGELRLFRELGGRMEHCYGTEACLVSRSRIRVCNT